METASWVKFCWISAHKSQSDNRCSRLKKGTICKFGVKKMLVFLDWEQPWIFIIMTLWGQSGPPMLEGRTGWSWCIKPIHLMHSMVCMVWYGSERYGVVWSTKIWCCIVMHETHSTDALNAINSLHDVGEEEESFRKDKKEKGQLLLSCCYCVIMLSCCYHDHLWLGPRLWPVLYCDHDHTVIVAITVIHQDQNSDQDPEDYETTLWHFNFQLKSKLTQNSEQTKSFWVWSLASGRIPQKWCSKKGANFCISLISFGYATGWLLGEQHSITVIKIAAMECKILSKISTVLNWADIRSGLATRALVKLRWNSTQRPDLCSFIYVQQLICIFIIRHLKKKTKYTKYMYFQPDV